jgi:hypothetical protein
MKHPEPEIVTIYRKTLRTEPPRLCHTCDNYQPDGRCAEFDSVPPESFAKEPSQCDLWIEEVPF